MTPLCCISHDSQGCSRGRHSNVKPEEPLKPEFKSDKGEQKLHDSTEIIYQGPKSAEALEKERPRYTHPLTQLSLFLSLSFTFHICSNSLYTTKVMILLSTPAPQSLQWRRLKCCRHLFFVICDIIAVYVLSVSADEPKSKLKVKVAPSLTQILEKIEISEREKQEKIGELLKPFSFTETAVTFKFTLFR